MFPGRSVAAAGILPALTVWRGGLLTGTFLRSFLSVAACLLAAAAVIVLGQGIQALLQIRQFLFGHFLHGGVYILELIHHVDGDMLVHFLFGVFLHFLVQDFTLFYGKLALLHQIVDQVLGGFACGGHSAYACQKNFLDSVCNIHTHPSFL